MATTGTSSDGRGREVLKSLRHALAAGVALTVMAGLAVPADAARKKARHSESRSGKQEPKYPFGEPLKGQLQIVVSIANQHLTLYNDGVKVAQAPVSTGVPGHPTPMGVFSVIEKDRYHHSNLYSNAPMPFMHRITWSGVAIHEGPLPGHPASHGCIRTTHDFVSRLWQVSKLGIRVIVSRSEVTPEPFEHPLLFNPAQKPASTPTAELEFDGLRPSFTQLGDAYQAPKVRLAWAASVKSDAKPMEVQQPQQPEAIAPAATDAAPTELAPPAKSPVVEVPAKTGEPTPMPSTEQAVEPKAPPAAVETAAPAMPTEPTTATAAPATGDVDTTASTKAPETPAPAAAPASETATAPAAQTPASTATMTEELPKPAIELAPLPRPSPVKKTADLPKFRGHVAVFVSRKEMKVYVRQGFVPLFDMPVEIADPKEPLGTHVFTALALTDDGAKLRWNVMTMPGSVHSEPPPKHRSKKSGRRSEPEPKHVAETKPVPTAAQALDRITLPKEAIERISEIITPGSSLVVSDQGLGRETGRYTDFIVETR